MQKRAERCFCLILYAAGIAGALWVSFRFLLPWAAPFLLAFALAAAMEPAVSRMSRGKLSRPAAAGLMSIGILGLILWLIFLLASKGIGAAADYAARVPELMEGLSRGLHKLEGRLSSFISDCPEPVEKYLRAALEGAGNSLYTLPEQLSRKVLSFIGTAAQKSPSLLLFAVTAGIGSYFFSASFPQSRAFIAAQLPEKARHRLEETRCELKKSLGGFLKSQLIMMAMTFFELLTAFLIMDIEGAPAIAAAAALIDALPVFGTGIILLPWAAAALLTGNFGRGLGLIISWAGVNLVRSCTQAKLLANQIGLSPIASLTAIYLGWKVWRVWGMLLFPLIFSVLKQLNEKGIIRLWKSV